MHRIFIALVAMATAIMAPLTTAQAQTTPDTVTNWRMDLTYQDFKAVIEASKTVCPQALEEFERTGSLTSYMDRETARRGFTGDQKVIIGHICMVWLDGVTSTGG